MISLGTLIIGLLLWTTLRLWGDSLQYAPYDHPLLKMDFPVKALEAQSVLQASEFVATHIEDGLYLKV